VSSFSQPRLRLVLVRDAKEKLCHFALESDTEMKVVGEDLDMEKTYELPDGNIIIVGSEQSRCPEVPFQPSLVGLETSGIHDIIFQSVFIDTFKADVDKAHAVDTPELDSAFVRELQNLKGDHSLRVDQLEAALRDEPSGHHGHRTESHGNV